MAAAGNLSTTLSKSFLCIGNKSRRKAKIQFTTKDDCEKYSIFVRRKKDG